MHAFYSDGMSDPLLYVKQLELGPMQNFVYLLGDPVTREATVVDPGWEVPKILEAAQADGYRLTQVFLTHTHFDHVMALPHLLKAVDVPVYVHGAELGNLDVEPTILKPVGHGDVVPVGGVDVTFIHTPGHTPGSQCFMAGNQLFSGDTLFIGGCGRCDLPGGNPTEMYHSLSTRLSKLPDATEVFPGHNYAPTPSSTIGKEKGYNPFLKVTSVQQFLQMLGFAAEGA